MKEIRFRVKDLFQRGFPWQWEIKERCMDRGWGLFMAVKHSTQQATREGIEGIGLWILSGCLKAGERETKVVHSSHGTRADR